MHSLEEARGWIEARVDDVYGSRVGQVVDVYFDPDRGEVHWMLVDAGTGEGELTLVPEHYSIATAAHVWVPITRDLIRRAPSIRHGQPVARDQEIELCMHYGGMRKRAEVLRRRPVHSPTSVPGSSVTGFRQQAANGGQA